MTLFEFVKAQLPILDIVSEYVKLRPMGSYHKGPCPFHSEKDASFTVSPDRQIFYCFGCQATGDVIAFFARLENLTQIEAVKGLIEHYSLDLPPEVQKSAFKEFKDFEKKDRHNRICRAVALWAHQQLKMSNVARNYLIKRSISQQTIDTFLLGYFPSGMAQLELFVREMNQQGILLKDLLEAGVLLEGKNHLFSFWEERILFPIKNALGDFVGFGGRVFAANDDRAKYINSKESEWFQKGKLLFGFDHAKKEIQQREAVFLVEGYMDCIAMAQHGYPHVVATLGTACTLEHLKMLSRMTPTIFLLYDGDKAGQNALLRIAQMCWQVNVELKVIILPDDHDPASFFEQGQDLQRCVNEAKDLFHFYIDQVASGFLDKSLSKKMLLAEKIIEVLSGINDQFKQEILLHQAAQTMQIPFESLRKLMRDYRYKIEEKRIRQVPVQPKQIMQHEIQNAQELDISLLEEKIFSVIMNGLSFQKNLNVDDWVTSYFSPKIQELLLVVEAVVKDTAINPNDRYESVLHKLNETDQLLVTKMVFRSDKSVSAGLLEDLVTQFFKNHWKQMMRVMRDQLRIAEEKADGEAVGVLCGKITELKQQMLRRGLI